MKSYAIPMLWAVLCVLVLMNASRHKSENEQDHLAREWYNRALQETEPVKKIFALQKAIELNPVLIEAYYELGLTYKNMTRLQEAEAVFLKAYAIRSTEENEVKTRIIYELGNLYLRQGRFEDAERTLKTAKRRAKEKDLIAKIAFDLGRTYAAMNEYKKAIDEFMVASRKDPKGASKYSRFIQLMRTQLSGAQQSYAQLQKEKPDAPASVASEPTEKSQSADTKTRNKIQAKVTKKTVTVPASDYDPLKELYQQALALKQEGKLKQAKDVFEKILSKNRNYLDVQLQVQILESKISQLERESKWAREYARGLKAFEQKNWTRAILSFENIRKENPNYKNVSTLLARAQNYLEQESIEKVLKSYYDEGITAFRGQNYYDALEAFRKVQSLEPNYKETKRYIQRIKKELIKSAIPPANNVSAKKRLADSLYASALNLADLGRYQEAITNLKKANSLVPDESRRVLISALEAKLAQKSQQQKYSSAVNVTPKHFYIAGSLAISLAILTVVAVTVSPMARARAYLLVGKPLAAAKIYERLIEKDPVRLNVYPLLANIYLMLNRRDEKAIQVYKKVLKLNLPASNLSQMNSIVTNHYISDPQASHEDETVQLLKRALHEERKKGKAS